MAPVAIPGVRRHVEHGAIGEGPVELLLSPLAIAGVLLACENDSSHGGGAAFIPDGGSFDAPELSDSPAIDAPPTSLSVTVSVTRAGIAAQGIRVVFSDAAGAVLQVVVTGADGKASSTGATPAMASALLGGTAAVPQRRVVTWVRRQSGRRPLDR